MILYRIKDWERIYENHESRKRDNLRWVPMPNKHDGLGYRRLVGEKRRAELFAAWVLMVEVASRGRKNERGTLSRDSLPLAADDLALITGFPADVFALAFTYFSDPRVGWLEKVVIPDGSGEPATDAERAALDAAASASVAEDPGLNGKERKGIEGKGIEEGSARARTRGPRSRTVPADFELTPELRQYARDREFSDDEVATEFESFREHEFQRGKLDWPATWREWVRKERKWRQRRGGISTVTGRDFAAERQARIDAEEAEHKRMAAIGFANAQAEMKRKAERR